LAWSYYHVGNYPQATRHFRQALVRQPRWEGLHTGLGWSRYRVGRYHLAIEAFHSTPTRLPTPPHSHKGTGPPDR
jgi:tetratricopeptide (TPR) repeat protein